MTSSLTGTWSGTLIYGPEYGELEGSTLNFTIDLKEDEGELTGTSKDMEGTGVNPSTASITGFIEDNDVSFIKVYQKKLIIDPETKEETIIDQPSEEISYYGVYDPESLTISGEWNSVIDSKQIAGIWVEDTLTGSFTMKKE